MKLNKFWKTFKKFVRRKLGDEPGWRRDRSHWGREPSIRLTPEPASSRRRPAKRRTTAKAGRKSRR